MKRELLGLALTGGRSVRMGEDKARMRYHGEEDQLSFCLQILDRYCSRVAVSVRKDQLEERSQGLNVECIVDADDVYGPMAGVLSALRHSGGLPVLVVACDMPFLDAAVLLSLIARRNVNAYATCFMAADGAPEPMCCIYEQSALPFLEAQANDKSYSLRRFLNLGNVETLEYETPEMLANVNTPEQAKVARKKID